MTPTPQYRHPFDLTLAARDWHQLGRLCLDAHVTCPTCGYTMRHEHLAHSTILTCRHCDFRTLANHHVLGTTNTRKGRKRKR